MTNKKLLEIASKLQKGCAKFCKENEGLYRIDNDVIFVSSNLFHELEREAGLLAHVRKKFKDKTWYYSAMTQAGVKIVSNETVL